MGAYTPYHPERSEGSGRMTSFLRMAAWVVLLSAVGTRTALAQVGHPPDASPYRDIRKGHSFTATGGYLTGDGGDLNIGPHHGAVFGARYDIRTSRTIQFGLGLAHGSLERFIVNPFVTLANRRSGPVSPSVTFAELNLQFNLTGNKSWRRIAPFVSASAGLAFASGTPADTSRYEFGNKFYIAPGVGFRFFLGERIHLRGDARLTFWKLNYPTTFQQEPVEEPGTPPNSNAVIVGNNLSEWTATPWFQAGLGYSFSP